MRTVNVGDELGNDPSSVSVIKIRGSQSELDT